MPKVQGVDYSHEKEDLVGAIGGRKGFVPYRIVRKPQGNSKSPTKYLKRRNISVLETADGEYHVDPLQDGKDQESGTEEKLSSQIKTLRLEEETSDEESDYGKGFQDIEYCTESFFLDV